MLAGRIWIRSIVAASLLGVVVRGLMMYIAWQHNPQGEFHDVDGVHWLSWLAIGLSWFAPVFVVAIMVIGVVWLFGWWISRYGSRRDANHSASGAGPHEVR